MELIARQMLAKGFGHSKEVFESGESLFFCRFPFLLDLGIQRLADSNLYLRVLRQIQRLRGLQYPVLKRRCDCLGHFVPSPSILSRSASHSSYTSWHFEQNDPVPLRGSSPNAS